MKPRIYWVLWKLFDSCSLNTISFRADLRALPSKYSATGSRLRVQATLWVCFNRWKFFLGYSNIPNPDQPWRGSVLTRKMSECGNGSPHWESKTHILLMLGWGLSCPHTKKSMWHSFRTKVSRDPLWKGAHFPYWETIRGMLLGKQCWWVSAVTHGGLLFLLLVSTPRQHLLVNTCSVSQLSSSTPGQLCLSFSPRPLLSLLDEWEGLEDRQTALNQCEEGEISGVLFSRTYKKRQTWWWSGPLVFTSTGVRESLFGSTVSLGGNSYKKCDEHF